MELQKHITLYLAIILISRSVLGFLTGGFFSLSATMDHTLLHLLAGLFFLGAFFASDYIPKTCQWIGWVYTGTAIVGVMDVAFFTERLGANTLSDDIYNVAIAITCLLLGYRK
ncbi:MAG: hypothetical protein OXR66_08930 [Candidatus Woesearchaeota archaeon]|nr:hypothetical protein [Candidatus Woesearchaeota archaeon]